MLSSARRTFNILLRTPLVPPPPAQPTFELAPIGASAASAGPSRPRAGSRAFSNLSLRSVTGYGAEDGDLRLQRRGYASEKGRQELYSDEAGGIGAGTDDVAHTDAAFNKNPNPNQSAKKVEQETGKDFTKHSPAQSDYSQPPGKQGKPGSENPPLGTSKKDAER